VVLTCIIPSKARNLSGFFCIECAEGKDSMERHFERDLNELKERCFGWAAWRSAPCTRPYTQCWIQMNNWPRGCSTKRARSTSWQLEIDDRVVQLLALHQLMAMDLRFVLAVSRINNDLETHRRSGRQHRAGRAANFAPSARETLRRLAAHERSCRGNDARGP